MTSYKCVQCGLVGWKTDQMCKRCSAPNTYLSQNNLKVNSPLVLVVAHNGNQINYQKQNLIQNLIDATGSAFQAVLPRETNLTALETAERDIRWAWKAGRIDVSLTIGFVLQQHFENFSGDFISHILFLLLFIISYCGINVGLIYGIYRKSRVCAAIIFCCAILSVLLNLVNFLSTGELLGLGLTFLSILFAYFYALGFFGTFKYHRLIKP